MITLETPIGLPPLESKVNYGLRDLAMPIVEIRPCIPNYTRGSTVYNLEPCFNTSSAPADTPPYLKLLQKHGYTIESDQCIKLAYLADSFPTEAITNEYGESILSRLSGTISTTAADISQIFGRRGVVETGKAIIDKYAGGAQKELEELSAASNQKSSSGFFSHVNKLLGGGRIDFPQLWRGSSFSPSYTLTVRLFNPDPGNMEATKKFIIGPIAAILLLGSPISQSGFTYSWPYLHKIRSRGIFNLNSGYISSITIIKGGDQLQIGFNQRLAVVDVRIEFGSIFNTMVAMMDESNVLSDRPTIMKYISELEEFKGSINEEIPILEYPIPTENSETIDTNIDNRVDSTIKKIEQDLKNPVIHVFS